MLSSRSPIPIPALRSLIRRKDLREAKQLWDMPNGTFFSNGACHVLTYAFLQRYPDLGFKPVWLKPDPGFRGNHIVAVRDNLAFDYLGYNEWDFLQGHTTRRVRREWKEDWSYSLVTLTESALIGHGIAGSFEGLRARPLGDFYGDVIARANAYLDRYPAPDIR